jgi:hypothetical protein
MPFILLALLGLFLKRRGIINDAFVTYGNKVIFYFGIPATIFNHIHVADLNTVFDMWFLVWNSLFLIVFFAVTWILAVVLMKDRKSVPPYVNSAYRSSLSVVAPPLFVLMFTDALDPNILPKGILTVSVLLILSYATASVMFAVHDPQARKKGVLGVLLAIAKNPIVIGVAIGLGFNVLGWTLPTFAGNTVNSLAGIVKPLAMICVGGNLAFHGFDKKFKYVVSAVTVKLFVMPIIAVIAAYLFGFRDSDLTIIMIVNALPMAVGAYVMQAELGGDTYIGASTLMITMTLSAFTLTLFIFLFRVFGWLV